MLVIASIYIHGRLVADEEAVWIDELDASRARRGESTPLEQRGPTLVRPLRVATYNIAHGRGLASHNFQGGGAGLRRARLEEIGEGLRAADADIVVLQEVDVEALWSHHVDQSRVIGIHAGLPYRAVQINFDMRLGVTAFRFGNAILSRYPIVSAELVELPGYSRVSSPARSTPSSHRSIYRAPISMSWACIYRIGARRYVRPRSRPSSRRSRGAGVRR
jgi:hypothetical protein